MEMKRKQMQMQTQTQTPTQTQRETIIGRRNSVHSDPWCLCMIGLMAISLAAGILFTAAAQRHP